jgi:predicted lipoprotein with Yx(FWY)xxD motif
MRIGGCCGGRWRVALIAAMTVGLLAGCGAGSRSQVVVRVGSSAMTRGLFEHWRSVRVDGEAGSRSQVLSFLIESAWVEGAAAEDGVRVSDRDARRELGLLEVERRQGVSYGIAPAEVRLQGSLSGGVTHSDRVRLMRLSMMVADLKVDGRRLVSGEPSAGLGSLPVSLRMLWTARTTCRVGFVVPGCAEYKGRVSAAVGWPYDVARRRVGVVVSTKQVRLGRILAAGPGERTVYLREADKGPVSSCYAACARVWLPVLTTVAPTLDGAAIPHDLGTTVRRDGYRQVTYFYHPLYYYVGDHGRGDARGQALESFGSRWYALRPIGVRFTGE